MEKQKPAFLTGVLIFPAPPEGSTAVYKLGGEGAREKGWGVTSWHGAPSMFGGEEVCVASSNSRHQWFGQQPKD